MVFSHRIIADSTQRRTFVEWMCLIISVFLRLKLCSERFLCCTSALSVLFLIRSRLCSYIRDLTSLLVSPMYPRLHSRQGTLYMQASDVDVFCFCFVTIFLMVVEVLVTICIFECSRFCLSCEVILLFGRIIRPLSSSFVWLVLFLAWILCAFRRALLMK